jgi:hypothetical protein
MKHEFAMPIAETPAISPHSKNAGIAEPNDLEMMHSILEDHFARNRLSSGEREALARELLQLFRTGVRDRGGLLAALAQE